jgi:hypothetical protein
LRVHAKLFHDYLQSTQQVQMTAISNKRQEDKYHASFAKEQAAHGAILHKRHRQHHWLTGLEQKLESQEQDREASGSHA